jgi:putative methionine-R-sulfoxide reductase with GAF domain
MAMPERLDLLEGRVLRHPGVRGRLLDPDEDPILKAIAVEAASELRARSASVSLLYEKKQLLKGAFPGSEERLVDRDRGMCQLVVRDRCTVEINDTATDPRPLPDGLRALGAYLGQPLHVEGEVVGALGVCDPTPRSFSDAEKAALAKLAERAEWRLAELSAEQRGAVGAEELLRAATRPVFQDLRNALWQLTMSIDEIREAAHEAQGLATLVSGSEKLAFDIGNAAEAAAHIRMLVDEAQSSMQRIEHGLFALEQAAQKKGQSCNLVSVMASAQRLAGHYLKLIGGMESRALTPEIVDASPGAATTQIATALAILAEALIAAHETNGKLVATTERGERIVLRLSSQLAPQAVTNAVDHLRELLGASATAIVGAEGASLTLSFAHGSVET